MAAVEGETSFELKTVPYDTRFPNQNQSKYATYNNFSLNIFYIYCVYSNTRYCIYKLIYTNFLY